ncbi:MAG: alpha/beta hydrolase [Haloarculaceae archaeon]
MPRTLALPGPRDRPASLDEPPGSDATGDVEAARQGDPDDAERQDLMACVVACPPHPQFGGRRSDPRLRAVSDALTDRGVACLRFDYGPWDEGRGEQTDVRTALAWTRERYAAVGLFGYSFGAGVALCGAADAEDPPSAVSVLAPPAEIGGGEVPACLDRLAVSVQVVVGERDTTVDSAPVADLARTGGDLVETFPGDHHFLGQTERIGARVAEFLLPHLQEGP